MNRAPGYVSTRDAERREVSFREALLSGLAPDGGLYIPSRVPPLGPDWLARDDFADLAAAALRGWLEGELASGAIQEVARHALDFEVPLVPLGDDISVLELFHGPTRSFKDFGARVMARLIDRYLKATGEHTTVLVATSGDTGSAVADGFAGLEQVRVALLFPEGRVSQLQERQLTLARPGVQAIKVAGDFDDCQRLVKLAFADSGLNSLRLSSANSINIGRLLPQTLYYLWAALNWASAGRGRDWRDLVFVVPCGNLGNLTAGLLAGAMSRARWRFVAAHNANDFFPAFLSGQAPAFEFRKTVATMSNAMDVGAPSNFERLYALFDDRLSELVRGSTVDDSATRHRMRLVYEATGYVACPHTAVGLEAAARYRQTTATELPVIVLATADPAKFSDVVTETLGIEPPRDAKLEALWQRDTSVVSIGPELSQLRGLLVEGS